MAVKVIDKLRFPTKQESQLRNEVAILQVAMIRKLGVGGWGVKFHCNSGMFYPLLSRIAVALPSV